MSTSRTAFPAETFFPSPYTTQIRDLVYQVAGIYTPDNRLRFLEERCARRMGAMRITSMRDYFEYLTIHAGRATEINSLLNEITIGETCFFRNQPQLDALMNLVVPGVVASRANQPVRHLRIWSAGCSTGEEPYTLAILLMEQAAGLLRGWTFEILATDLNERSLLKAQQAVYGDYALRNVSAYHLSKYFKKVEGGEFQVSDFVRSKVRFSRVNLLDDSRMAFMKGMDVIFCCNVLIYFDSGSKRRVVQHFYNNLLPNSYLFLGHSESLFGITADFRLVHMPSATAYLKVQRGGQSK